MRSYVRSDGTTVRGHYRANRGPSPTPARSSGNAGNGFDPVLILIVLAVIGALAARVGWTRAPSARWTRRRAGGVVSTSGNMHFLK
ncbi:hypothetical protein [Streptomonospora arabica]|uniref:Uncharacterized protein n=1 Tax=Streptomonospora arabica TaxID=412417 RepID=A0ABV9ST90_9ACTN